MLCYTNVTASGPIGGTTYAKAVPVLTGANTYLFPWICTARDLTVGTGETNATVGLESARTASRCYMRGLKEVVKIRTNNGRPWQWRRVCFTMKGDELAKSNNAGSYYYTETTDGIVRVVNGLNNTLQGSVLSVMFDGYQGSDWLDVFSAKLDTQRISVKYDKQRIIQSGNDNGVIRMYKDWFPMNKNISYADDERGAGEDTNFLSATSKEGMGDYYVMDFLQCGDGATSADVLTFQPEATLYWHEK